MSVATERDIENDDHWTEFAHQWLIRSDTTYLNHGSWGPPPQVVRLQRRKWIDQMDSQPMDFFIREYEPALENARTIVAEFVGTTPANFVFVENATFGMNVVAANYPLEAGDNVLLNNHEYGAVHRIWQRACQSCGAEVRVARLPDRFECADEIVDCLRRSSDEKTRLVVFSHITSPTALIMPARQIASAFKQQGIDVCIDGPHAPAQIPFEIDELDCDFYSASCHKWLSAGFGSGFLYVHPRWHNHMRPVLQSWGRLLPALPATWDEEFIWSGTRDPSAYLSIPTAIEYITSQIGLDIFRERTRFLASRAEQIICEEFGTTPIGERSAGWYGSMAHIPLPAGDFNKLQGDLWKEYRIEVPIICFEDQWFVRVSCHLYNNQKHLESLKFALRKLLL